MQIRPVVRIVSVFIKSNQFNRFIYPRRTKGRGVAPNQSPSGPEPAGLRKDCAFTLRNIGSQEGGCVQRRLRLLRTGSYNRKKRIKHSAWEGKPHTDESLVRDFTLGEMELVQKFELVGHVSMIHPTCTQNRLRGSRERPPPAGCTSRGQEEQPGVVPARAHILPPPESLTHEGPPAGSAGHWAGEPASR